MELANILSVLWRWRFLTLVGLVIAPVAAYLSVYEREFPPRAAGSIEYGIATTYIKFDAQRSPLVDLTADIGPLVERASLFAQLAGSEPVKAQIARQAKLQPWQFVVGTRLPVVGLRSDQESVAEQQASEIAGESVQRRLLFVAEAGLPLVLIYGQAATSKEAIALANAGAKGLIGYIRTLQGVGNIPDESRIRVVQLAPARGGLVNQGAGKAMAVVVYVGVVVGWCLLVLLIANLVSGLRAQRASRTTCVQCGTQLDGVAHFCSTCGRRVDPVGAPEAEREPVAPAA